MSSKNVAIRKDVYDALDKERRTGESFSRLFARLLTEKGPLEEIQGAWGAPEPHRDAALLVRLRGHASRARGRR